MDKSAHIAIDETKFNGVLPSRADGQASKMEHAEEILRIADNIMRALEYNPPPISQDPALHKAVIDELRSWNVGKAADGLFKCVDLGVAAAQ
ncbi:hypothetical protein C0992_008559, partial [Termitomyces sp. T32_za158]